ncbi:MAG: carboxypeptidase regulatory-like domain-containing protein, partial [Candidatus Marinimicrobia bacterium]|nr:carboxypeptidase regulatory-like domain-containing protein [Candidatus Neomarinimicrobiota bacterium]
MTKDVTKAIQKSRILKTALTKQTVATPTVEKTVPQPMVQRNIFYGKTQDKALSPKQELIRSKWSINQTSQLDYSTFSKSVPELTMTINGNAVDTFAVGESMIFTIITDSKVELGFYLDDGDGAFNPELDFNMAGEKDETLTITDNDDMDQNRDVGTWEITMCSSEMMDGPFFGIQNATFFITGEDLKTGGMGMATARTEPADSDLSIAGYVDNGSGSGAEVLVLAFPFMDGGTKGDDDPGTAFGAFTDASGNYVINIDSLWIGMDFDVFIVDVFEYYPGLFPDPMYLEIMALNASVTEQDFELIPGDAHITGTLTDETGTGIPGIPISANAGPFNAYDTTDASGHYDLLVIGDSWWVDLDEDALLGNYLIPRMYDDGVYVESGGTAIKDFMTYAVDGIITGTVLYEGGAPVEDVEVGGDVWIDSLNQGFETYTYSAGDGTYSLPVSSVFDTASVCDEWSCWPEGGYWVNLWMDDPNYIVNRSVNEPSSSGDTDVNFELIQTDAVVYGMVSNEYGPCEEFDVHAYTVGEPRLDTGTRTGWEGEYELHLLGGMEWVIEVFDPWQEGWYPVALETLMVAVGDDIQQDFYISDISEGEIFGVVMDEGGLVLAGLMVELKSWNESGEVIFNTTSTNPFGEYAFYNVPFGWYDVCVYLPGETDPQACHSVDLNPMNSLANVDFMFGKDDKIQITGFVYNNDGETVMDAFVEAFNYHENRGYHIFTNDTGYFELFVEPGGYDFIIGAPGFYKTDFWADIHADTTFNITLDS